ncbi:hypothetical protein J6N69_03000 [bacterium]|nr:hypothetical protein [bacterium]
MVIVGVEQQALGAWLKVGVIFSPATSYYKTSENKICNFIQKLSKSPFKILKPIVLL